MSIPSKFMYPYCEPRNRIADPVRNKTYPDTFSTVRWEDRVKWKCELGFGTGYRL